MQTDDDKIAVPSPTTHSGGKDLGRGGSYALYCVAVATVAFLVARVPILARRFFDVDEFEHAHAAWSVFKGLVPYRDFFEHHTPWYYYFLAPFFRWFDVGGSFESARHFLVFGRVLSTLLTVVSAAIVIAMGRLWIKTSVGLVAALLFVSQPVVFQKTVEMRPDVLALPFFVGCLACVVWALDGQAAAMSKTVRRLGGAGLCLGGAIMCTQKMLFVIPGLATGLGLWSLWAGPRSRANGGIVSRLVASALCGIAIAVPAALTWAAFSVGHGGYAFIANNFLLNSKWTHVSHEQLLKVLETSWPVLILCLLGIAVELYRIFRVEHRRYGSVVLSTTLFGLIVGILVVPGAHRQYYLMIFPIVCVFAARGLVVLIELARRPWMLVLAILPLAILPVAALAEAYGQPNGEQLAKLRYVLEKTGPNDVVMDGIEGMGLFRPHAIYFYFLHAESLEMLTREQLDVYVDELINGKVHPRLIALDDNLISLGIRFLHFVRTNYQSSDGFFYFSKQESH
jgi:4-amino-4-deoxy-L-arabinose transferase-like glycosyltransferase